MYSNNVSWSTEYFLKVTGTNMTIIEINEYQDSTSVSVLNILPKVSSNCIEQMKIDQKHLKRCCPQTCVFSISCNVWHLLF